MIVENFSHFWTILDQEVQYIRSQWGLGKTIIAKISVVIERSVIGDGEKREKIDNGGVGDCGNFVVF